MQRKFTSLVLLGATILSSAGGALATPSNGFTSTPLAKGQIGAFEISNFFVSDKGKLWLSFQKTIGKSDTYVLSNVWQPGGARVGTPTLPQPWSSSPRGRSRSMKPTIPIDSTRLHSWNGVLRSWWQPCAQCSKRGHCRGTSHRRQARSQRSAGSDRCSRSRELPHLTRATKFGRYREKPWTRTREVLPGLT